MTKHSMCFRFFSFFYTSTEVFHIVFFFFVLVIYAMDMNHINDLIILINLQELFHITAPSSKNLFRNLFHKSILLLSTIKWSKWNNSVLKPQICAWLCYYIQNSSTKTMRTIFNRFCSLIFFNNLVLPLCELEGLWKGHKLPYDKSFKILYNIVMLHALSWKKFV